LTIKNKLVCEMYRDNALCLLFAFIRKEIKKYQQIQITTQINVTNNIDSRIREFSMSRKRIKLSMEY